MGTAIRVELVDGRVDEALLDEVFDWFRAVDARFSLYRAESEVSRLARGELSEASVHADIREVLELCEDARVWSGGAFDIRRHRRDGLLDPTGLVKGWSVDRAGSMLSAAGATGWSINAGGDVLTRGRPGPDLEWRIGIQHPQCRDAVAAVIKGTDLAVATSGAYERGDHIRDPGATRPLGTHLSVTVIGPRLALADAYATAAFTMGDDAAGWFVSLPGYEACLITATERMIWTAGMGNYIDPA